MKKQYIIPAITLTKIHCEKMISESIVYDATKTTGTRYVKEDIGSSSSSNYNVWNDDWSE